MATVRSLAEQLGISHNTVALALRNHPSVAAATKKKVQAAAQKAGYEVNPVMNTWMNYVRSHRKTSFRANIALLHPPDRYVQGVVNPFYQYYEQGIREQAKRLGYVVDEFELNLDPDELRRLDRILRARGIYSLMMIRDRSKKLIFDFPWQHYVVATVENPVEGVRFNSAANHHYHTATLAISKAVELGYQRIGFAASDLAESKIRQHMAGSYLSWQQMIPPERRVPLPEYHGYDQEAFLAWVKSNRVDLVMTTATVYLKWLRQAGYRVPEDIGFIDLAWYPEYGNIAGVDQKPVKIGQAAMDVLATQFMGDQRGVPESPRMLLLESVWNPGNTVRDQGGRPSPRARDGAPKKRPGRKGSAKGRRPEAPHDAARPVPTVGH